MINSLRRCYLRLENETRDLLGKEIEDRVTGTNLDSDADASILARIGAHVLRGVLPGDELSALRTFATNGEQALVLSNLPCQRFPTTPVTGFATEPELAFTNAIQLGLIELLGLTPYAVDYENKGKLLRNVVPNPSAAGTTSSWGADSEFFWHTDNPHLPFGEPGTDPRPFVPRYLTFFAVRNSELVPTEVMSVSAVTDLLNSQARAKLAAHQFQISAPDSNDTAADGTRQALVCTAVLENDIDGECRVRYDRGTTSATTASAHQALADWAEALRSAPCEQLVLAPGEFLIFDNYRVLHRRRAFKPAPANHARWLRRCYAS